MANKRDIKKDIRYLTEQVITEAIDMSEAGASEEDRKKIVNVIIEVVELHNNLISRTNHTDGKDNRQIVKQHFRSIIDDLMEGCNKAFNELNQIIV